MKKHKKRKRKKARCWHALNAILMSRQCSSQPDKKARASKQACRGRFNDLD